MKRDGNLWRRIVAFDNLLTAFRRARRGKRSRDEVATFSLNLEPNLLGLQQSLSDGSYRPGGYRLFAIYDRKPRTIAAAPFADRVVQHALMNIVEPLLDRRLIHHCYACRPGKGTHAAVEQYQQWSRKYPYVLKLDIQKYFASVDHQLLKDKLARCIKDKQALALFSVIIDSANTMPAAIPCLFPGDDLVTQMNRRCGLPIGNLTSQILGNLYLSDLDHAVTGQMGAAAYLRYVDDLILLDSSKQRLWDIAARIERFVQTQRLNVHPRKVHVMRSRDGVDVLGYRIFPGHRRLRSDNGYRFRRRLRALSRRYARRKADVDTVKASVAAWLGHVRHADSAGLQRAVLGSVTFQRRNPESSRHQ